MPIAIPSRAPTKRYTTAIFRKRCAMVILQRVVVHATAIVPLRIIVIADWEVSIRFYGLEAEWPFTGALRQRPAVVGHFAFLERFAELRLIAGFADHGHGLDCVFARHAQHAPRPLVVKSLDAMDNEAIGDALHRQTHPGGAGAVGTLDAVLAVTV